MYRIFIMSSERSGSNLIRNMLGAHDEILAPTAIHFTTRMAKWSAFYQYVDGLEVGCLVRDMLNLARSHIAPWDYDVKVDEVVRNANKRNFWSAFVSLYDTVAKNEGKTGWVCKDNALYLYAPEIISHYPDTKFIYLVRDGRDVALSFLRVPTGPNTLTDAASLWTREQQECIRLHNLYPDNVFMLRYEDILTDTESQIVSLCQFLGLTYLDRMISVYADEKGLAGKSVLWENLNKPIIRNNYNKWRRHMNRRDALYYQHTVHGEAQAILKILGYRLLEGEVSRFYLHYRSIVDHFKKACFYIKNKWFPPERIGRLPKRRMTDAIRKRLLESIS